MNEQIDRFLNVLEVQKQYSAHTILAYRKDIQDFRDYMLSSGMQSFEEVDYSFLRGYLSKLYDEALQSNSIARKLSSLRSFFDYLLSEECVKDNPFRLIKTGRKSSKNPDFLFYDEVDALLEGIDTSSNLGVRNRAMLELMYASGLRASEVVSLTLGQIDFDNMILKVYGKGKKERLVPFHDVASAWLKAYIDSDRTILMVNAKEKHDKVFVNKNGDPLSTRGLRDIVDRLSLEAGLGRRLHPHTIRHTFATHLLDQGAQIVMVQEMLGHESLATTQIYTHVSKEKLKATYKEHHPLEVDAKNFENNTKKIEMKDDM